MAGPTKGPGPRRMQGPKSKIDHPFRLIRRIWADVLSSYAPQRALLLGCSVARSLYHL